MPGSYTCEQFDRYQSSTGDTYNGRLGGIFQTFDIYGRTDEGVRLSLAVSKALSNGFFSPSLSSSPVEQQIREYNSDTRKAEDWGPARRISDASVMNFTNGTMKCIGLKKFGGFARGGFDHVASGYFCAARSTPYTDEEVSSLINAIVVRESVSASQPSSTAVAAPAPATTVVATPPASASASATPPTWTFSRNVASATRLKIGFWYSINPDCTSRGYPTLTASGFPTHGNLTFAQEEDFTDFKPDNQRYQCNTKRSPVSAVYYESVKGYTGTDKATVDVIYPSGNLTTATYNIVVR